MKKLLATILALVMALGLCSVSWAEGNKTESDYTFPTYTDLTADSDGVYNVENEQKLRTALYFAPTDGTTRTIKLTNSITLEMLYTATLFDHSNEAGTWTSNGYTSEAAEKMAQDSRCAAHKDYENDEAGEIIIKGNATLNHPTTKTINAKGGEVTIDSATITSNAKAISAGGGKVTVNDVTVNGSGTVETKDGGQVVINQGSFQSDVSDYVASGSQMTRNENGTYSVTKSIPSTGGYYYHPTTDTKADETKGSPKTFDAGVGIYAVTAVLSVTGMAWVGKKRH